MGIGLEPTPISARSQAQDRGIDYLTFLGHATAVLRLGGTTVITDPVLRRWVGPLRRRGSIDTGPVESVDVAAISHLHRDHLDRRSLRMLPPDAPIIVPRGAGRLAADAGVRRIIEVSAGDEISVGTLRIEAVPALHDPRRGYTRLGPRAEPLGYVISSGERHAYFAGDTELFAEMTKLRPLDLALLPVGGWGRSVGPGHLDPEDAARALILLRPKLVVPIHWGTYAPAGVGALWRDRLLSAPYKFKWHAQELAPDVRVQVLQPGHGLTLDEWEAR